MVLFILILVGRAGGKTCYEYDTNTNTYKYEKNIKINWKLKFVLLDIYMYVYIFFGWWWYERCRWCRKHESTLFIYIHDGILELKEMSFAGKGGGWVRYSYSYMGIGIGWNVLSLLEWEMWVSSFVQSLVRKYGVCVGGGERFVFETSTTTLKTKTKNKRYKRNIQ